MNGVSCSKSFKLINKKNRICIHCGKCICSTFFVERVACRHIHFLANNFLCQEINIKRKEGVKNRKDSYHSVNIQHEAKFENIIEIFDDIQDVPTTELEGYDEQLCKQQSGKSYEALEELGKYFQAIQSEQSRIKSRLKQQQKNLKKLKGPIRM